MIRRPGSLILRGGSGSAIVLTAIHHSGSSCPVQVHSSLTVAELKGLLEPEFRIPASEQDIRFQGQSLSDSATLEDCSVTDNCLVAVSRKDVGQRSNHVTSPIGNVDLSQLQDAIRHAGVSPSLPVAQSLRSVPAAPQPSLDPLDERVQASIEQQIRRTNVDENFRQALEHTPEAFGKVPLLRVRCEVNRREVVAVVDTGAEATIMSEACAERLGLMRLVDERFRGTALGVGSSRIIGRVHVVPLQLGGRFLSVSLTVLAGDADNFFLFGLDNLRRHQCCIDLKQFRLLLGDSDEAVPFLSEAEGGPAAALTHHAAASLAGTGPQQPAPSDELVAGQQDAHQTGRGVGARGGEGRVAAARRLEGMGFGATEVQRALEAAGGDESLAVELITAQH